MSIKILSLGGGVQSSTLALMAEHGELEKPIAAIFADTGDESGATYAWLDWLELQLSYPVIRTSGEQTLMEHIAEAVKNGTRVSKPPLFTASASGDREGLLTRDCTRDFKVCVI